MNRYTFPMKSSPIKNGEPAPATKWWRRFLRPINDAFDASDDDDTGWISPTLLNSWANVAGGSTCQYRRRHGITYLKGLVSGGTLNPIFVLPAGFGPQVNQIFVANSSFGAVRIDIKSDLSSNDGAGTGEVTPVAYMFSGDNSSIWLDSISWSVYASPTYTAL